MSSVHRNLLFRNLLQLESYRFKKVKNPSFIKKLRSLANDALMQDQRSIPNTLCLKITTIWYQSPINLTF